MLDLFKGMQKKWHCDLVCGAPVDDWVNAGSYSGEYDFNSLGSWSCSKEWVWNLRTKI